MRLIGLLAEQHLDTVKDCTVDQWIVKPRIPLSSVKYFTDIGSVAENRVQFASSETGHLWQVKHTHRSQMFDQ